MLWVKGKNEFPSTDLIFDLDSVSAGEGSNSKERILHWILYFSHVESSNTEYSDGCLIYRHCEWLNTKLEINTSNSRNLRYGNVNDIGMVAMSFWKKYKGIPRNFILSIKRIRTLVDRMQLWAPLTLYTERGKPNLW